MYDISIIIPTYNPGEYFLDCINSICSQTFGRDKFELIIVLNGEIEVYRTFLNNTLKQITDNFNIKILESPIKGVSNARNIGIDNAEGKYIVFLDDDDVLSSNYLEAMFEKAKTSTIVASNVLSFYKNLNENIKDYLSYKDIGNTIFERRKYLSNACCKLIPRDVIKNNRFNLNFKNGEDALFMFSISNRISQIVIDKNCIYYRRLRPNSASRKKISLINRLTRIFKQQVEYTRIYFTNPCEYNFILYLSRLLAVYKQ